MFFDDGERVRIVALANPLLPKALLGAEGHIEYPAGNCGFWYGPPVLLGAPQQHRRAGK